MSEKKKELLMPRYKVLCRYPDSPFRIWQIIEGKTFNVSGGTKFHCQDFPAIFQSLPWYADRKEGEMPEYLKIKDKVYKIKRWEEYFGWLAHEDNPEENSVFKVDHHFDKGQPATEQEYIEYVNQKQKPFDNAGTGKTV